MEPFPEGFPNNPNEPFNEKRTTWNLKATGSYDAMWGIRISPVLRHQSGSNFARTISVPASAATAFGLIYSGTIYAEPANANREDNITVFDFRAEKTVNFGAVLRALAERAHAGTAARIEVRCDPIAADRLSATQAVQLANISRGALGNSLRHAKPQWVEIVAPK